MKKPIFVLLVLFTSLSLGQNHGLVHYKKYQGFVEVDRRLSPYEQIRNGIYNEMMHRKNDALVAEISNENVFLQMADLIRYFCEGGKWDHKAIAKRISPRYVHKSHLNKSGLGITIFGTTLPGDSEHIYDHDMWSNIHYGYTMKLMRMGDWITHFGSKAHDWFMDADDEITVQIGMDLYEKYGHSLTLEQFEAEILAKKDKLKRYKKSDLYLVELKPA